MRHKEINIVNYADDAALVAESKDDLQRLLHQFNQAAKSSNRIIADTKTKCMNIRNTYPRSRRKCYSKDYAVKYMDVKLSTEDGVEKEVREQVQKAAEMARCLG